MCVLPHCVSEGKRAVLHQYVEQLHSVRFSSSLYFITLCTTSVCTPECSESLYHKWKKAVVPEFPVHVQQNTIYFMELVQ